MAYTPKGFSLDKQTPFSVQSVTKLRSMDTALASDCSGYVQVSFANDKLDGSLGVHVIGALNEMSAAMANAGAHYAARVFTNDKNYGHVGPDVLAKLNAMSAYVASLRP